MLVQKVFFAERRGELQFEVKAPRPWYMWIITFIVGETDNENFAIQLTKVRALLSSLQNNPLSNEERERCERLEERINALGRHVFTKRKQHTYFCFAQPVLSFYQLRVFSPTHTLVKPDMIKRGLKNLNKKLCWLNASVKFLAANKEYDSMLMSQNADPQLEGIRKSLFRLVDDLRRNWHQYLIDSLQQELVDTLRASHFRNFLDRQEDADEFILQVDNHLLPEKPHEINLIKIFTSFTDGIYKDGAMEDQRTNRLQIAPNGDEVVDIEECFTREDVASNLTTYYIGDDYQADAPPLDFGVVNYVSHYPKSLEITQRRNIVGYNPQEQNGIVSNSKLRINNGIVELTEYEPVYTHRGDNDILTGVRPSARCTFRAIAAIERRGGISSSGHFVTHTRARDGTITTHDDHRISHNRPETVWQNAYYLMLRLVHRENLPAPN
jgi:hypothetical protein